MLGKHDAQAQGDGGGLTAPLRWMGHIGYIAEGVVYILMGALALAAALKPNQEPNSYKGALSKLDAAPFGEALLALLAAGLLAFVLWEVILAALDPEHSAQRHSLRRRLVRLGHLCNGALHSVLAFEAVWRLLGFGRGDDHGRTQAQWTARAMQLPLGRWAVAGTGVGIFVFGLYQWYRAATHNKIERVDLSRSRIKPLISALGCVGLLARGVLFAVIGWFLIDAAHRADTAQATGIAGALAALKHQQLGPWVLAAVGIGIIAYGLFTVLKEPYRDFRTA